MFLYGGGNIKNQSMMWLIFKKIASVYVVIKNILKF